MWSERIYEHVKLAEEAALAELEAFGSIGFEDGVTQAEWDETSPEFWEFACDLWDEPKSYVLTELY